jgi:signal transduction histidine kinase/DNA-binding response OmpR family regulator
MVPDQPRAYGVLIAGISPHRELDESYRTFFDLAAGQVTTAIRNANAYQEERRRAEALAEIDRAKTLFFSNVSHEFRTPLTLMMGPIEEWLFRHENLSPADREQINMVHRNGLRMQKLVNTLLDFSRIEAGRVQAVYKPTDLPAFTAELAGVFRSTVEKAGIKLVVDCPSISRSVHIDREMWEKIVLNLVSNAFKFTFEGQITVAVKEEDGHAVLSVRDTGTGIPESELPNLFKRFYRVPDARGRTYEGSGIGLSLIQELVRFHGGTIEVESAEGLGSTFTIRLPLGRDHLPAERVEAESTPISTAIGAEAFIAEAARWLPESGSQEVQTPVSVCDTSIERHSGKSALAGARIVIADDNSDMRRYLGRIIVEHGGEVIAAADGEAALSAIHTNFPSLVITDVMMPKLDGFGLLREMRADADLKTLPVIMLSARAGEEAQIEGLEAGADDYLVKPFSERELVARVRAQLELEKVRSRALRREQAQNVILETINGIFREALTCETEEQMGVACLKAAEDLTRSKFGFISEFDPDGQLYDIAISDPGWDACAMVDQSGHRKPPIDFKIRGLHGRVVLDGKSLFTNDPGSHADSIGTPPGHPPLSSFLGVPLIRDGKTVGLLGRQLSRP